MLLTVLIILLFVVVSYYSEMDLLGLWLVLLVTHGIYVKLAGEAFQNAPAVMGLYVIFAVFTRRGRSYWRHKKLNRNVLLLFAGLFIMMIITGFFGINPENSMFAMHLYMKGFVLTILIYLFVDKKKDIEKLALYYLVGAMLGVAWIAWEYFSDTMSGGDEWTKRAAGLRADPNETAMLLVVGIPIAWYFALNASSRYWQVAYYAAVPLIMWGMVLTGSRGGLLALALVIALIIINKPSVKKVVTSLLLLVAIIATAPGVLLDRTDQMVGEEKDSSIQERTDLLISGLKVFAQKPLLGVGPGNIGQAIVAYKYRGHAEAEIPSYLFGEAFTVAHNLFLEMFGELGVLGGFLFLGVIFFSLYSYWRAYRRARKKGEYFSLAYALLTAMAGFLFAGLFLSQGKESVLWFLLGMGLAYPAGRRRRRKKRKKITTPETSLSPS